MGFKKNNVTINKLGINIPEAYAQIDQLNVDLNGECFATFKIQISRETMDKPGLDIICLNLKIDKDLPIHKQVYEKAKSEIFSDWNDDIVENTTEE